MIKNDNNTAKNNIPPIPPHMFSVVDVVRRAFQFIIAEWPYLARLSVPVICLQIGLSIALFMYDKQASNFTNFLVLMPASVFMGWFTFSIVRLIIFGERLYNLPIKDVRFMQYRAGLMKKAILTFLLFKMGGTLIAELAMRFSHANPSGEPMPPTMVFAMLAIMVIIFWAIRLIALPLLITADYPIKLFLKQASGFMFSLKIIAVMFMSALPAFFILNIFAMLIVDNPNRITDIEIMLITALQAPFMVIISGTVSAAVTFALKEMLGQNKTITV